MDEPAKGPRERAGGIRRRTFLTGAAASVLAAALPAFLRPGGGALPGLAEAARIRRFRRPLPIPPVLTGDDITIRMRPAWAQILPGAKTRLWTYNGTFPGPTIRRTAGQETRVTFVHELGRKAGALSVHLHGGHNRCEDDGHPGGLTPTDPVSAYCDITPGLSGAESGNDLLIRPGQQRTYTYELTEDGSSPERAAFQWYHDHRLDNTARNVWRGLAGMWILDDDVDYPGGQLGLPSGEFDVPLMIADRSFDDRNQLTNPFRGGTPPFDQVTGRHVLVNGVIAPKHAVKPQRYRLRVLNASNFRAYNLALSNGDRLLQIGTEAGLMPQAVSRRRVLVGPGERVELLVDFAGLRGRRVRLTSVARADGPDALGSTTWRGDLLAFRVADADVTDLTTAYGHGDELPERELPAWTADPSVAVRTPDFTWEVGLAGFPPKWTINGRTFSPDRVETEVEVADTVVWELRNRTKVAHMMHLHQTDWLLLGRRPKGATDWVEPPPWERCLKETFFMDPGERILVAGRPTDHLGKFVVHCHMLDHEDHGLMSQFRVVEAAP